MDFKVQTYGISLFLLIGTILANAQIDTEHLTSERASFATAGVGTKVFFAGGVLTWSAGLTSSEVDIYDISTSGWESATLSVPRRDLVAASVGTKVLFAGGHSGYTGVSNVVDIYDNSTNMWSTAELSEGRSSLTAVTAGNFVFFAGGSPASDVVDIYDNLTNTWSTAKLSFARPYLASTAVGTKVFFAGGEVPVEKSTDIVDVYDIQSKTWSTEKLSVPRRFIAATSVGTKAIFAGGRINSNASRVVDIYDVVTKVWTTEELTYPCDFCGATSMGSKVFVANGDIVDVYDILSKSWNVMALPGHKIFSVATSLKNYAFFTGSPSTAVYIYNLDCPSTPSISVEAESATICEGDSTILFANGALYYSWYPLTGLSATTVSRTTASPPGTITYLVEGVDANGCSSSTSTTIKVNPRPEAPQISFIVNSGSVVLTSSALAGNEWFKDGVYLPELSGQTVVVDESGIYQVRVRDEFQCTSLFSDEVPAVFTSIYESSKQDEIFLSPNPSSNSLNIDWRELNPNLPIEIQVIDSNGKVIYQTFLNKDKAIDIHSLNNGIYFLVVVQEKKMMIRRFTKV